MIVMRTLFSIFGRDKKSKHLENAFSAQRHFFSCTSQPIIFDVGAYIGEVARTYREIFSRAQLYCFEPFPDSFRELEKFSADPMVKLYPVAISDQVGKITLNVNTDLSCNSIFPRPRNKPAYYPAQAQNVAHIEVNTTTIDSFCHQENIERIDILKLDVEGAELKALKGAHHILSQQAVYLLYTEVMFIPHYEGGCLFHEIVGLLDQYGYSLFNLFNLKRAKDGQLR